MSGRLRGKVVWITGSTQGIGAGVAGVCAAEGAKVIVSGRNSDNGEQVAASIRSDGGSAVFARCDVTAETDVESVVDLARREFGGLHGVVANASGYASWTSQSDAGKWVTELSLDAWNETLNTDLTGTFLTLKHAIRAMCEGDGGSVVTVSSHTAMEGVNGNDAYTAAKGGVISLTRSVASYYGRYNVRANCLAVGFVDSGPSVAGLKQDPQLRAMLYRHSLGRIGSPQDIGYAATYLLADESRVHERGDHPDRRRLVRSVAHALPPASTTSLSTPASAQSSLTTSSRPRDHRTKENQMTNKFSFAGKRVVVTGAASGMGRAAAQILLDDGADVVAIDLNPVDLPGVEAHALDLTDPTAVDALTEKIEDRSTCCSTAQADPLPGLSAGS